MRFTFYVHFPQYSNVLKGTCMLIIPKNSVQGSSDHSCYQSSGGTASQLAAWRGNPIDSTVIVVEVSLYLWYSSREVPSVMGG